MIPAFSEGQTVWLAWLEFRDHSADVSGCAVRMAEVLWYLPSSQMVQLELPNGYSGMYAIGSPIHRHINTRCDEAAREAAFVRLLVQENLLDDLYSPWLYALRVFASVACRRKEA